MRTPQIRPSVAARSGDVERRLALLEQIIASMARPAAAKVSATTRMITQASHGFAVKDVVRHNGTSWTKSKADTAANAVVGGMVIAVLSPDVFILATPGSYVAGLSGLTAGSVHYLSAATAGALTTTAPTISVPVVMADTTSSGVMLAAVQTSSSTGGFPIPVGPWHMDVITASAVYTVADAGDATLCVLEFIGGGGGGGYAPSVAPGGFGGGGGASGVAIRSPILAFAAGYEIDVTIGSAGTGGTSGAQTGTTGGDTTVSMDGFHDTIAPGGYGGKGGGISSLAGDAGQGRTADTPYAQSSNSGEPGTYGQGGSGGLGLSIATANYGGGGLGATPDTGGVNGGDGVDGAVRIWTNGSGITLTT